jgi:DNA polymerase-3 subunit epsilon
VPLAFVDLEMTGLNPEVDRIVEVCIERVAGDVVEQRLSSFVRPEAPDGARHIHGIGAEELAGAPPFAELAPAIDAIFSNAILVAHAAEHDIAFLRAAMSHAGRIWEPSCYLDTLRLSRRVFPAQSHRLEALALELGLPSAPRHRAEGDVCVLRALFERLVAKVQPENAGALWRAGFERRMPRPEVLETLARALDAGQPVQVRYRASARGIQEFDFCVRAVRTDLDPPLVLGYLHRTRGRRELRADRIVTIEMLGNDA